MNLNKHIEFFNPAKLNNYEIHVIGVGAVGSYIALTLAKLGIKKLYIWDFDTVEEHNITNQVYTYNDLGKPKTLALKSHLEANNPNIEVICKGKYIDQNLKGMIFLTVDRIKLRKTIIENLMYNPFIKLVIDGRIGLEKGQVITTTWDNPKNIQNHIALSDFEESEVDAPISACGTTLSVAPSVLLTAQYAVAQLINFANKKQIKQLVQFDAFDFRTIAK